MVVNPGQFVDKWENLGIGDVVLQMGVKNSLDS